MKKEEPESESSLMTLSPRQHDVLTLIACGFTDKEIAVKLKVSIKTIQTHDTKILLKLNARTRAHAVMKYFRKNPKWKTTERSLISV